MNKLRDTDGPADKDSPAAEDLTASSTEETAEVVNNQTQSDASNPRTRFQVILNIVVSFSVLALCIFVFTLLGERKSPQRAKPHKANATAVTTQPLYQHDGKLQIETNGVVVPSREIRLATEVAGRVVELSENLRAGKRVTKGETLIKLDPTDYQLNLNQLLAQQKQEAAELQSNNVSITNTEKLIELAERQTRLAVNDRKRAVKLMSNQAISASEVDIAERAELTAQSSLIEVNNNRRDLEAKRNMLLESKSLTEVLVQRAKLNLERCVVTSPIDGRIVQSSVEEQSFVAAGTSFVTIEDTSKVEVRSNLTADQMVWVWSDRDANSEPLSGDSRDADLVASGEILEVAEIPKIAASITYKFGTETHSWPAVLGRVDGLGIDLQTRTYPCLFIVKDPNHSTSNSASRQLTRGMFVNLALDIDSNRTLYDVPKQAIRPGNRLWINDSGKLRIVPVSVVTHHKSSLIVALKPTDMRSADLASAKLVTSPISHPTEGMPLSDQPTNQGGQKANAGKQNDAPAAGVNP